MDRGSSSTVAITAIVAIIAIAAIATIAHCKLLNYFVPPTYALRASVGMRVFVSSYHRLYSRP